MPVLSRAGVAGRPTALPWKLMLVDTTHTLCTPPIHPRPYMLGFPRTCFHTRVHTYTYTLTLCPHDRSHPGYGPTHYTSAVHTTHTHSYTQGAFMHMSSANRHTTGCSHPHLPGMGFPCLPPQGPSAGVWSAGKALLCVGSSGVQATAPRFRAWAMGKPAREGRRLG